eukprot:CAMPEP_0169308474 /NCGR_PEP_ID=MMETSP1017-20121227/1873_1 /TAXON_ID=342587 /ORGANISM="Karlodinium micrum, Strain CCMP2283" /LENGTH=40 /DNA_ID= /DNA_START= /DNA_END= /DNA_ORIENTATION=
MRRDNPLSSHRRCALGIVTCAELYSVEDRMPVWIIVNPTV